MKILDFPELRQAYEYDCDANALQSVLTYYGIEVREGLIIKNAGTDKRKGTSVSGILRVLKKYGLKHEARNFTTQELKKYINQGIPVIILLQAWNKRKADYAKDNRDGHWVVVIGYQGNKFIFEDPYAFKRVFLTEPELKKRWHAKEKNKKLNNFGITAFGKNPVYNPKKIIHMK